MSSPGYSMPLEGKRHRRGAPWKAREGGGKILADLRLQPGGGECSARQLHHPASRWPLIRHASDAQAPVFSSLKERDLSLLQGDDSIRGIRLSGRISTLPECLWTGSPPITESRRYRIRHFRPRLAPELTHKRLGPFEREGRLCDALPGLT